MLPEIESDNSRPNISFTSTFFWRVLNPSEKVVRILTLKSTDLKFKVKIPGASKYREIAKA